MNGSVASSTRAALSELVGLPCASKYHVTVLVAVGGASYIAKSRMASVSLVNSSWPSGVTHTYTPQWCPTLMHSHLQLRGTHFLQPYPNQQLCPMQAEVTRAGGSEPFRSSP